MRLDPVVAQIISAPNFNHFSTIEVRSAYVALKADKTIDPNDARRFVYRELLKLVKHDWLRKTVSKKKEITSFTKTEHFDASLFEVRVHKESKEELYATSIHQFNNELFKRLSHYKDKLLTGLGEVDEYKKLCELFPHLQGELQPKYNQVREDNSKLLGSIKVIESLIEKLA